LDKITQMEASTNVPHFWDDQNAATKTFAQIADLKESYYPWKELVEKVDETAELIDLYQPNRMIPPYRGKWTRRSLS
jgi:peptide chain release factor 2